MKLTRLAVLASLLATTASGQNVLFEDTFDAGLSNWTASAFGLNAPNWHWAGATDPCVQQSSPSPGSGGVARMGDPDCTFNSIGGTEQILTLTTPVYVPLQADDPVLTFRTFADTEGCFHWDFHYVEIQRVSGGNWSIRGSGCGQNAWYDSTISLDDFRGEDILIRFRFDPVDASANDGLGWLIDDVRVQTAHCSAQNFCVTTPNSASPTGARMGYSGSGRIHLNNFVLEVSDGPANEFVMFFCGPDQIQTPLGDGTLCIGGGSTGLMRLGQVDRLDGQGHAAFPLDFNSPDLAPGEFLPGSNWQFQCWFRDGAGGPAGSNLSDGLSVTFCP